MAPSTNNTVKSGWSFMLSAPHERALPDGRVPEFAFMGRSNVGKSSLLNALMDCPMLARVSKKPGCTQAINFYHHTDHVRLVDLPGMGYAKVSKGTQRQWDRLLPAYLTRRPNLVHVYLLVDSRHPIQPVDQMALDFLRAHDVPFHIILTKVDCIPSAVLDQRMSALALDVTVRLFPVSARKNKGIDPVRMHITTSLPDHGVPA
jgi:GTP-binding protein